jgi:2-aminoethylphosphonate-pyruvate transaminase
LLVDSMSAFGALEIDARKVQYDALAASSNKCLEGVPGLGFVVCRKSALASARATPRRWCSICYDPGRGLRQDRPIPLHAADPCHRGARQGDRGACGRGRRGGRGRRYRENAKVLIDGMRAMGFRTLLGREAPGADHRHLSTCRAIRRFVFQRSMTGLKERGYVIYPGKLTVRTPSAWAASAGSIRRT